MFQTILEYIPFIDLKCPFLPTLNHSDFFPPSFLSGNKNSSKLCLMALVLSVTGESASGSFNLLLETQEDCPLCLSKRGNQVIVDYLDDIKASRGQIIQHSPSGDTEATQGQKLQHPTRGTVQGLTLVWSWRSLEGGSLLSQPLGE